MFKLTYIVNNRQFRKHYAIYFSKRFFVGKIAKSCRRIVEKYLSVFPSNKNKTLWLLWHSIKSENGSKFLEVQTCINVK